MNAQENFNSERGFTLIELLVAIVVVGILTATAIVGVAGLTDTAKKATCQTTLDASRAGVVAYFSSQNPNKYPANFDVMTGGVKPVLVLQGGVQHPSPLEVSSGGNPTKWTITLDPVTGKLTADGDDATNCV